MVAMDLQNVVAYFRRGVRLGAESTDDYTIMVPIYGTPEYMTNLEFLKQYKANTLIVANTTTKEMSDWADGLETEGWRIHRTFIQHLPRPSVLMKEGICEVTTKYALRLDADSTTKDDIGLAVASAERAGIHLCSVQVVPSRRKTLAEKLQGVEYDIAMRNRFLRPWNTSGACYIGRTDALRTIHENHTCGYFAEDVEMGLIAKHFKMSVGYISNFYAYTDVPETFKALGMQRRAWWAGTFQLAVVNADKMLHYPIRQLYYIALVYLLLFNHWLALGEIWQYLPYLLLLPFVYACINALINWPVKSRWFFAFPLYATVQSAIFPIVGVWWFFKRRRESKLRVRFLFRRRRETWTAINQEA